MSGFVIPASGIPNTRVPLSISIPALALNNSTLINSLLGTVVGNAWTFAAAGGSLATEWNTAILGGAMVTRAATAAVANGGAYHRNAAVVIDLFRYFDRDPAWGPILRRRLGTWEIEYDVVLSAAGVFAGLFTARFGVGIVRSEATGYMGTGMYFLASETSPNWRAVIEQRGDPAPATLDLAVDFDTGIPYELRAFRAGIRIGALSEAEAFCDWIVNGNTIHREIGPLARVSGFWGTVAGNPAFDAAPEFSVRKTVALDPTVSLFARSCNVFWTPPVS